MHEVINGIIDKESFFEIHKDFAENIIVGFDWQLGLPYRPYQDIRHNPGIEKKKDTRSAVQKNADYKK